ncbi:MAG: hypothetical protein ACT4OI_09985, partial [Methanobacteriota archaeon]
MREVTAEEAVNVLRRESRLHEVHVTGRLVMLSLVDQERFEKRFDIDINLAIRFSECIFDELDSSVVWYTAPVEWDRCIFRHIQLANGVYFLQGLVCRDSEFLSEVLFDSGGHNDKDHLIIFERVRFHGFVDFFDSWFTGPIVFRDVAFLGGTNLLNEERGWVQFDVPPVLERVSGTSDLPLNLAFKEGVHVIDELGPRERARRQAERLAMSKKKRLFRRQSKT